MKQLIKTATLMASLVLAFQANATIFDFEELTDTSTGQISGQLASGAAFALANPGESAFNYFDWTKDGITLTAMGSLASGSAAWAYLDANDAGLGVCSQGTQGSNQCAPSSDDNVTIDEILEIAFSEIVAINFTPTIFRNAGHGIFEPDIEISLDTGIIWAALNTSSTLTSDTFFFRTLRNDNQFYIDALTVAKVPAPATLALFGLGLAGLSFARRRKSSVIVSI